MLDDHIDEAVEEEVAKLRWNEEFQRWESDDGNGEQM